MYTEKYQQGVITEKLEVEAWRDSLVRFLGSDICRLVGQDEADRIRRQAACLNDLARILGERIAAFGDLSRALDSGLATATVGDLGHE